VSPAPAARHGRRSRLGARLLGAAALFVATSAAAAEATHTLAAGETLPGLATQLYGSSWKAVYLTARNGLASERDVPPGTKLLIPACGLYKVHRGETLAEIAKRWLGDKDRFKVLAQENGIKDATDLEVGAELLLPFVLRHVVEPGDSWTKIAQRYYRNTHRAALVKDYNAAVTALNPGEKVLVPIFDRATVDASSRRPAPPKAPPPATAKTAPPAKAPPAQPTKAESSKTAATTPARPAPAPAAAPATKTTAGAAAHAGTPTGAAPRPATTATGGTATTPSATAAPASPPPPNGTATPASTAPSTSATPAPPAAPPPSSAAGSTVTPAPAPTPAAPAAPAAAPVPGATVAPLAAGSPAAVASLSPGPTTDPAPRQPHSAAVDVVRGLSPTALHTLVLRAVDEYRRGEFEVACGKLEAALGAEVLPLADRAITVSHLGFCAIAAGDRGAAVDYFKKWLELDAKAELDPVATSPKILAVFREVAESVRGETNEAR
jgi:hypothetical protein